MAAKSSFTDGMSQSVHWVHVEANITVMSISKTYTSFHSLLLCQQQTVLITHENYHRYQVATVNCLSSYFCVGWFIRHTVYIRWFNCTICFHNKNIHAIVAKASYWRILFVNGLWNFQTVQDTKNCHVQNVHYIWFSDIFTRSVDLPLTWCTNDKRKKVWKWKKKKNTAHQTFEDEKIA